jgi:serine protease inhibitor
MNKLRILPLILVAGCATNGTPSPETVPAEPPPIPEAAEPAPAPAAALPTEGSVEELATLAAGNTAFALDLYRYLAENQQGNLFLSPASISAALAMTRGGARGTTAAEMDTTLHFSLPQERLHPAYAALDASLNSADDPWELAIANRLWGQQGMAFEQPFLDLTRTHYGAEMASVDFAGATEPTRLEINGWVSDNTAERIPELLKPGVIDASTALVLTNAIYFLGTWDNAFDPALTSDQPFTTAAGKELKVPLMFQESTVRWSETEELALLALPYSGDRLEMVIALPAAHDGLPALEAALSPATLAEWDQAMRPAKVKVWLPRFELNADFELSKALGDLGMPTAFGGGADFSGMTTDTGLFISAVVHQAFVDVNEQGTEAAAATAVVMTRSAKPRVTAFRADHPFLFMIRDTQTGSVLFMGRMVAP